MERSRRTRAAAALSLGCVLVICGALAAPALAASQAAGRATPKAAVQAAATARAAGRATPKAAVMARAASPTATAQRLRFEPATGAQGLTVAGVGTYRGAIEVVRTGGGLAVVNEVGFEDYVKGISEVPNAWPIEALKAQAIAARTYALWEFRRQGAGAYRAAGAHICATQACQVYTGLAKERSQHGNRWAAAVEATKSQVLWWRDGPIVAKYSSSNGGESVPGGQPYLRAIQDPDDRYSPLHQWRVHVGPRQLAAAVGLAPRAVTAIQRAGDAVLITAKHDPTDPAEEPAHLTVDALTLRDRVNTNVPTPAGLPKTLPTVRFNVALSDDASSVVFDGRGWGHGIGLSQWGAFGKAARGMKAPDILAAYYAGLKPVAVPVPHVPETIKVAVALDHGPTSIRPADEGGRMRVVNGDTNEVLSHGDAHAWALSPARDRAVTGVAAPEEAAPATVRLVDEAAKTVVLDEPLEVRVRLDAPATFAARATPPGPAPVVIPVGEPQLLPAGEVVLTLPAASAAGDYVITVDTDRGGGRTHTSTITLDVVDPAAATIAPGGDESIARAHTAGTPEAVAARSSSAGPEPRLLAVLLAVAALAAVATGAARAALGRTAPSPLH